MSEGGELSAAGAARKRRPDRAATETSLRQAALRLLRREGVLAGLSLQEVADEAGVNRGLIHHYFGSRRALMRTALKTQITEVSDKAGDQSPLNPANRGARLSRLQPEDAQFARMVMLLALDGDEELGPIPHLEESIAAFAPGGEGSNPALVDEPDVEAMLAAWTSMLMGYLALRPALARQLGVNAKTLDSRVLPTISSFLDTLSEQPPAR